MKFHNLRDFVSFLESKGDLLRIKVPVSRDLEITEIAYRCVKSEGPALLFENVEGFNTPVLINIFGAHRRMNWALGVENSDELTAKAQKLLDLVQEPPSTVLGKLRTLKDLVGMARTQPKIIKRAPCQDIVLEGDAADLNILPALKCWPMDGGRYITLPLVISRDPLTGRRNIGTYRMQIRNSKSAGMHWQTHKVGAKHYRAGEESGLDRMEVAVALGGDPTTIWSGAMPLPPDMDEIAVAGVIRDAPVELVKCKTIDLEVPAHAEYILEGYVNIGELAPEGPFGDHTGYYSMEAEYPVFHLTAITHRRDAVYPATIVGRPPTEDFFMGKAIERLMLPVLRATLPEIVDVNMPAEGIFHNLIIVSIKKEYPGHSQKVMHALWGLGLLMLVKTVVVVDHNVNVHDLSEVAWRATCNIDPSHDIIFTEGPADDLDHATVVPKYSSKMGIDATAKGKFDGRTREWPPDIVMNPDIVSLVEKRWEEYGF